MNYEQKENTGAIFLNDKREKDTQPMYKGKLNYKGQEIEIALWVKDGKNGKFFSAKLSEPFKKEESVFDVPF